MGEACVHYILGCGGRVAIFDMDRSRGEKLAKTYSPAVVFRPVDVTSEASVESAISETLQAFNRIDVVINCAGVANPGKLINKKGPLPLAGFNRVVEINLIGTFNVIRLCVEQMVKNSANEQGEKGIVINTSSVAAFDGQIGQPAYSASKAGVAGMTLPLARECAEYGIRVMAIAPGLFNTPMVAGLPEAARDALSKMAPFPKRLGEPQEFAELVGHIIENPMLNGEVIRLDGAIRMAAR